MNLNNFLESGGLKVLAVAKLNSCSYSLVLYLINCIVAKIDEIVSSAAELSILLGVTERQVKLAIDELIESNIIIVSKKQSKTLVLKMNLNATKWKNLRSTPEPKKRILGDAKNLHSLIPQKRTGGKLVALSNSLSSDEALLFPKKIQRNSKNMEQAKPSDEIKILTAFAKYHGKNFDEQKEQNFARLLLENHPFEQILSLINFFAKEIPSLSMLVGAWFHYMNKYKEETSEVDDLNAFRKKHEEFDSKIRSLASLELKKIQKEKKKISADEELLLHILIRHEQPRKQLYWALKARDRYPALTTFLDKIKSTVNLN